MKRATVYASCTFLLTLAFVYLSASMSVSVSVSVPVSIVVSVSASGLGHKHKHGRGCIVEWLVMLKASVHTAPNSVLHVLMQIADERRLPSNHTTNGCNIK